MARPTTVGACGTAPERLLAPVPDVVPAAETPLRPRVVAPAAREVVPMPRTALCAVLGLAPPTGRMPRSPPEVRPAPTRPAPTPPAVAPATRPVPGRPPPGLVPIGVVPIGVVPIGVVPMVLPPGSWVPPPGG